MQPGPLGFISHGDTIAAHFSRVPGHLFKNGVAYCDLLASKLHQLPTERDECWHDCIIVATKWVDFKATDVFSVRLVAECFPFIPKRCRISVEGWNVTGQLLCRKQLNHQGPNDILRSS